MMRLKILFSAILKYNNIINYITKGLLFLTKKNISFDKKNFKYFKGLFTKK